MKRAIIAATALLSSTIMSTPASAFTFADGTATIDDPVPAGITNAAAQAVCDAKASAHGTDWTGTVASVDGDITSGPTADGTRTMVGSATPGDGAVQIGESVQVTGDPFRIGGSVNMFGFAQVIAAHWSYSQYDFTQHFAWQSTYTVTCDMAQLIPVGIHTWLGLPDTQAQANCEGDKNPHETDDRGANCPWTQTGTTPEDRGQEQGSVGPVSEGGTLNGHESMGPSIPVNEGDVDLPPMQVVVCISPSTVTKKLPGAWTPKNGYSGGSAVQGQPGCNTGWYNGGAMTQPSPYSNLNTGSNNIVTIPAS
jgi:hypothetical protein